MEDILKYAQPLNRIVLGLLMLVPGLLKIFVMGPDAFAGMLNAFGGLALPLAWIIAILEVVTGIAILINKRVDLAVWPPIVILLVASFMVYFNPDTIPTFLVHIAAVTNYFLLGTSVLGAQKSK